MNRRHIRVKVMQSIYALIQSKSDDLKKEEKFLKYSISKTYDLYILVLDLLSEIRNLAENHQEIAKKKHLATSEDINPNRKFIDNQFLQILKNNESLKSYIKDNKLINWKEDNEYVRLIWDEIKISEIYLNYLKLDKENALAADLEFVKEIYKSVIAPNDKLFDYFESQNLSWVDDIPFVNTWFINNMKSIRGNSVFNKNKLYKDKEDEDFVSNLFRKTALHHSELDKEIDEKTPNWDTDRIAEVDFILMKMALVEFVHFPSIPTRVTINEYIEIAKDYSTSKSGFFINGVLDKLLKEYTSSDKITKIGRGLL
jgi:N utilization substance protein B